MLGSARAHCAPSAAVSDTLYVVPEIVVRAARPDRGDNALTRSGFVALVDMRQRRTRVEDLPAVLSQLVGVHVRQYGGLGDFATVSIRGSSSNHVNVFLDGIPLNDPYLGITDISELPLGGVGTIEVYRGFSPPELGLAAIGGAVNLVTDDNRLSAARTNLDASVSYGAFETARYQATAWAHGSRLKLMVHGAFLHTRGDFGYLDDNGTPQNSADDSLGVRVNNDADGWNLLARASVELPRLGTLSVGYDGIARTRGVPGLGSNPSPTARSDRERHLTYSRMSSPLWARQVSLDVSGFFARTNDRFLDSAADIGLVPQDTDNTIDVYGGRAGTTWLVPMLPARLLFQYDARKEQFHPVTHAPVARSGPDRWRRVDGTLVHLDVYAGSDRVVLSAAQRWEKTAAEYWEDAPFPWLPPVATGRISARERTPSAGVRWQAMHGLTLKSSVGRYYRTPTFLELFGNAGSVTGNPRLEAERGTNRDVGMIATLPSLRFVERPYVEIVYLNNDVDDLILFFPNSQYTSKPTNIGAASISGWEVTASGGALGWLRASANYTRLDSRDTSDIPYYRGNELPSRPKNEINASLSGRLRRWIVTYEFHFLGSNYLDRANQHRVPARHLHSLIASVDTPLHGLTFAIEGRNLTDNQVSDVGGYPLPGRSFYTTIQYSH